MEPYRIRRIHDPAEWHRLFQQVHLPHMVQSWAYGEAKRAADNWHPLRIVLERIGDIGDRAGEPAAVCQILQKRVGRIPVVSRINRGPVFLDPSPSAEVQEGILRALRRNCRFFAQGAVLIAPALAASEENHMLMRRCGFILRRTGGWSSTLLDLRQDEEILQHKLSAKWRRNLKVARQRTAQSGAVISTRSIEWLQQRHEEYQHSKEFRGPSAALLGHLYQSRPQDFLIMTVEEDGEAVGAIAVVRFGTAAEYYIGWNSEQGKRLNSGTFLLWHAVERLKQEGVCWLDLGGYSGTITRGFNEFKRGIGGLDYALAGEWVAF